MREPDIFIYVAVGLIGTGGIVLGVLLSDLNGKYNAFVEHVALQHKESDKLNHMRFETAMLNYETALKERKNVDEKLAEMQATVANLNDKLTNLPTPPAGPDAVDILNAARGLLYPYDPATGTPTAGPPTVAGPDGYPATQPWGTNAAPNPIDAPPSDDELAAYLPDDAIDPAAEALAFFDRGMGIEGEVAGVVLEMDGEVTP